jgi:hypothetical protein
VACFAHQGVNSVTPCGCRYRANGTSDTVFDFLPNVYAAEGIQDAWHEWLGSAWYWIRGRM